MKKETVGILKDQLLHIKVEEVCLHEDWRRLEDESPSEYVSHAEIKIRFLDGPLAGECIIGHCSVQ